MENMNVPNHIAIIIDGNGRWEKAKGMPRGYMDMLKGCANLEQVCYDIKDLGVKYLTVYAFSTENWKRSREEVEGLMKLFPQLSQKCIKISREKMKMQNHRRYRLLFAPDIQERSGNSKEFSKRITMNYISACIKLRKP